VSRLKRFQDVAERHLCTGCGTCAYLAPDRYRMVDSTDGFRRPLPLSVKARADDTLRACPGASLAHRTVLPDDHDDSVGDEWGPVLEVWEGWAGDDEMRWEGSSGGVASALAMYALDHEGMAGVLHTRPVVGQPLRSETVLSRTRPDVLSGAGSRYAPASPCDGLARMEAAEGPCAFVGKPCDVAGAVAAAECRPSLSEKLGISIAVFCAGTPSSHGTLAALSQLGLEQGDVTALRYRGHGWPGEFTATTQDGREHSLTYEQSWGSVLQKHRQWRCMICPDHTGEFADLSVGDPWYRDIAPGEPGRSLVVVRTERGRRFLAGAMASGAVRLVRVPSTTLVASQPNLLSVRGAVLGRVLTMKVLGLAAPRYRRIPMIRAWLRLPAGLKLRSTIGTARRIRSRGLRRRFPVREAGRVVGADALGS
jgi:coenzyme F420 hydrogenase subunit beta